MDLILETSGLLDLNKFFPMFHHDIKICDSWNGIRVVSTYIDSYQTVTK